jgi:hypothetical protein
MPETQPQFIVIQAAPYSCAALSFEEHAETCIARLRCASTQSTRIRTQSPFESSAPEGPSQCKTFPSFCAIFWTSCILTGRCLVMCLENQGGIAA